MRPKQLSKVADTLGISRMSVSLAINHCPGVGSDLRNRILSEVQSCDAVPETDSGCDVYVILPENPSYFWGSVFRAFETAFQKLQYNVKFNVYSKLNDKTTIEHYLQDADRLSARIVLIAANYEGMDQRLAQAAARHAVFSVFEPTEAPNVFYFGSDREADGRLMAYHCLENLPDVTDILLIGDDQRRSAGFCDVMNEHQVRVQHLSCSYEESPANVALRLSGLLPLCSHPHAFGAAVCVDGITPKVCMALKKCKLELPVFGFEHPVTEDRYGKVHAFLCQDIQRIADETVSAVDSYLRYRCFPACKYTIVPSAFETV